MIASTTPRVLFVSYNSLIEPLGSTQVVPYVEALARDCRMTVLSFEKRVRSPEEDGDARRALDARLRSEGVDWIQLSYHRTPSLPATLYDIAAGLRRALSEHRKDPFALVHARGYVPGAIAWGFKRFAGTPYLFDIRGLQAEEYADAGHWNPRGLRYRLTKAIEARVLRRADGIVTLTEAIRPVVAQLAGLRERPALPPWSVIPSCVDLDHFAFSDADRQRIRTSLGLGDRPVLVYAGSIGTWYLLDEMLDFFDAAREAWPGLFLMLLVNGRVDEARARVRAHGLHEADVLVRWVHHHEMPAYLSAADAGMAFIRSCLSKRSSSPTKYGEYLACGLPLVINAGVGDADELLGTEDAGTLVSRFDRDDYRRAAGELRTAAARGRRPYREIAERRFSLRDRAYPAYRSLYEQILARRSSRRVLFLTPYPLHCAPSQRLKFEQYYRYFEDHGIQVSVSPFVTPALWRVLYKRGFLFTKLVLGVRGCLRRLWDFVNASRFDAVYVHLWSLPFGPPWFEEALRHRGIPVVYDIDDLIYLPRASEANPFLGRLRKEARILRIVRAADRVIVCTRYLERFVAKHNPRVTLISSTIDTDVYVPRPRADVTPLATIGWSGSHSTAPYLHQLDPVLRLLSKRFALKLLVIGDAGFAVDAVNVDARPWTLERETDDLAQMDVGVYPLPDEEWVLGKSGLKALQYMGMGVPVVASRIGAACEFIKDGENGFLASTREEWIEKLSLLIQDPTLRSRIGAAGRRTVEERYSIRVNSATYLDVLTSVFRGRSAGAGMEPDRVGVERTS